MHVLVHGGGVVWPDRHPWPDRSGQTSGLWQPCRKPWSVFCSKVLPPQFTTTRSQAHTYQCSQYPGWNSAKESCPHSRHYTDNSEYNGEDHEVVPNGTLDHSSRNSWLCISDHHIGVLLKRKKPHMGKKSLLDAHNHKQHVTHLLLEWQVHRVLRRWRLVSIWCVPSRHWLGRWLIPRGLEPRLRWCVPGQRPRLKRLVPGLEPSLGRWKLGRFIHWWSWWIQSLRFYGSCEVRRPKTFILLTHISMHWVEKENGVTDLRNSIWKLCTIIAASYQ